MRVGQLTQLSVEQSQLIVAKCARGQGDLIELFFHRRGDLGVTVTLVDGRIGAQAVHISNPLYILNPDALALSDDDIQGRIVAGPILLL